MPKNKKEIKFIKYAKPYLIGVGKGCAVFTVLFFLTALFMLKANFDNAVLYFLIYIFIIFGSFISAVSAYKKVKNKGFLTGVIVSIPYSLYVFLLLCIINSFHISSHIVVVFLITIFGGMLGGITAANFKL